MLAYTLYGYHYASDPHRSSVWSRAASAPSGRQENFKEAMRGALDDVHAKGTTQDL